MQQKSFQAPILWGVGEVALSIVELRDGRTVAVKRLNIQGGPDVDYLFLTEVSVPPIPL